MIVIDHIQSCSYLTYRKFTYVYHLRILWKSGPRFHQLTCSTQTDITIMCVYVNVHSRSTSFLTSCLNHSLVGDSGQPDSARHQHQFTDDRTVYARPAELLDLPDLNVLSSSASKSVEYSIKNVLISIISSISSGRLLKLYNEHIT